MDRSRRSRTSRPRSRTVATGFREEYRNESRSSVDSVRCVDANPAAGDAQRRAHCVLGSPRRNRANRSREPASADFYGGGTPDFCGGTAPFNGPVPRHYNDGPSVAVQRGQVACLPKSAVIGGKTVSMDIAPAPSALFGTPRTMFNPRQLQISMKFTFWDRDGVPSQLCTKSYDRRS
jgi:hypothetical protein